MTTFWIGDNNELILEKQEKETLYCDHCNCELSLGETYTTGNGEKLCDKCYEAWFLA